MSLVENLAFEVRQGAFAPFFIQNHYYFSIISKKNVPLQRGEDRNPALRAIRILSRNPKKRCDE